MTEAICGYITPPGESAPTNQHRDEMPLSAMMRAAMGAPPDRLTPMWQLGEALISGQAAYERIEALLHGDAEHNAAQNPLSALADEIEASTARTEAEIRVKLAAFIWCRDGDMFDREDMATPTVNVVTRSVERRAWTRDTRLAVGIAQELLGIPRDPVRTLPCTIDGRAAA